MVFNHRQRKQDEIPGQISNLSTDLSKHVIICGYGQIGQNVARLLQETHIPFIALDLNISRINEAQLAGDLVCYADATRYSLLKSAKIEKARALAVCFHDKVAVEKILQQVRQQHPKLPIIVRTHDATDSKALYQLGATEIIPETLEAGLVFASHLLLLLNIPIVKVKSLVNTVRKSRYDLLHQVFPDNTMADDSESTLALHSITLPQDADAVGKQISQIKLSEHNVRIIRIRRKGVLIQNPTVETKLKANDVVVLYGELPDLEACEALLLQG